jgi:hypothetical protein
MSEAEGHVKDRPIGAQTDPPLPLPPVAIIYKDRHVMLTREKLADLAPGGSKMILVPFGEVTLTGPSARPPPSARCTRSTSASSGSSDPIRQDQGRDHDSIQRAC